MLKEKKEEKDAVKSQSQAYKPFLHCGGKQKKGCSPLALFNKIKLKNEIKTSSKVTLRGGGGSPK